ncbi:hypothetical protein EYZ11_011110 [Aspergillus tanneri]|nr:hypothetical protein EYZ11_011110 [Aspergillus tanneri]
MGQFLPQQTTSASNLPTTTAQSFSQNIASMSMNDMASTQQHRPMPQPNPSQAPSQAAAQPPSPAASARERARVSILLDINSMLLQEVVNLQSAGKAGGPPAQQGSQDNHHASDQIADATKGPVQKPSSEYFECMRRLQANLAYLATVADRAKKSGGVPPPNPGIMTPPPHMPAMNEIYNKLSELFPRTAQGTPHQSPQPTHGNGKPSPSSTAEPVV